MKTYWVVYREESNYSKPSKTFAIAVFENETEANGAVEYARKMWCDSRDADYVFYRVRPLKVFTEVEELTHWNDFPSKALEID